MLRLQNTPVGGAKVTIGVNRPDLSSNAELCLEAQPTHTHKNIVIYNYLIDVSKAYVIFILKAFSPDNIVKLF